MYSNPPVHGARIVANVVGDPTLFNEWKEEMEMLAGRIKNVRQKLFDSLSAKDKSGKDWSFILKQIGMFSFTGLNKTQVISPQIFIILAIFEWFCCGRIIKKKNSSSSYYSFKWHLFSFYIHGWILEFVLFHFPQTSPLPSLIHDLSVCSFYVRSERKYDQQVACLYDKGWKNILGRTVFGQMWIPCWCHYWLLP